MYLSLSKDFLAKLEFLQSNQVSLWAASSSKPGTFALNQTLVCEVFNIHISYVKTEAFMVRVTKPLFSRTYLIEINAHLNDDWPLWIALAYVGTRWGRMFPSPSFEITLQELPEGPQWKSNLKFLSYSKLYALALELTLPREWTVSRYMQSGTSSVKEFWPLFVQQTNRLGLPEHVIENSWLRLAQFDRDYRAIFGQKFNGSKSPNDSNWEDDVWSDAIGVTLKIGSATFGLF